jgi:hypothetical protein
VVDTVNQVTQPVVNVVDQTVQQTVDTVDQTLTTVPGQALDQVGQTLPVTQPVVDTVTPLLPAQPVVAPLVNDTTDTVNAIVNQDVVPATAPVGGDPVAPITDPTTPVNPTTPVIPTTPIVPVQPVGTQPIAGGAGTGSTPVHTQQPGATLTQPTTPGATAPITTIPTQPDMPDDLVAAQTPNGIAVDSQAGLPLTPATSTLPVTSTVTLDTTPIVPVAHAALGGNDWTTPIDATAGAVLHDLARAAHELRVSAPSEPLHEPIPVPSAPIPSLPLSGSSATGGAAPGLSISGASGAAGMAAVLILMLLALATTQRSLLARALDFPTSIIHAVPTSPA